MNCVPCEFCVPCELCSLLNKEKPEQRSILFTEPVLWMFSQTPLIFPKIHEQMALVAEVEVIHVLSNVDFYSTRLICLQPLPSVQRAYRRDTHWAPHLLPLFGLIILDHIHPERGSTLFSLKQMFCEYICLPIYNASDKSTIHGFKEYLILYLGISCRLTFGQATHFTENELVLIEFIGLTITSYHRGAGLIGWWNVLSYSIIWVVIS